jgi:hypothetical protein
VEIKFVGLSGHLELNAPGHHETFHKGLMEGLQKVLGKSNVIFLGSERSYSQDCWFEPLIPASMTSTISWLPKKFLNQLGDLQANSKEVKILYLYEGTLANLFLLASVVRRSNNVYLYFNLFNSFKYYSTLQTRYTTVLYKAFFLLASRGVSEKMVLVADTERFGDFLTSKLGETFSEFPIYSALQISFPSSESKDLNLVNIRGVRSERLLKQILCTEPRLQKIKMEVHGVLDYEVIEYLKKFPNVKMSKGHIGQDDYFASYAKYSRATFIYDPEFFSMQSSGRLADAVVAGASLLVPQGTSLEDVLNLYGHGSSFDFNDENSLAFALLSEPKIPKRERVLPTADWAAATIFKSVESLIVRKGKKRKEKKRISKMANYLVDEIIWVLIGCLRLLFGLRNRILLTLGIKL